MAWLWCKSPPHPREPLRDGLGEGAYEGFYLILLTGEEKIIN
jgi:hypothetical protein